MTNLSRVTGKIFGETATATGDDPQIGQFGSALAGTYNGTTDVATIQNLAAWSNGFIDSVTPSTQFPPLPEMTGFGKVLSYHQNYLLQKGVAEWDSGTTYYVGDICKGVGTGVLYISKSNNNLNHAVSNTTYWEPLIGNLANKDLSNLTTTGNNKILPSQSGNSGKYLTTNGTVPSWTDFTGANQALSNLTSDGNNRLHALKGYLDEGELLTDSEGLADVTSYANSTDTGIDTIKPDNYTVVGSPTISEDGVASGLSTSNYLTLPNLHLEDASSWEIVMQIPKVPETAGYLLGNSSQAIELGRLNNTGNIFFKVRSSNNTEIVNKYISVSGSTQEGILKIGFTGTQYYINFTSTVNTYTASATQDSTTKVGAISSLIVGYGRQNTSLDLNTIRAYVDGDLVYQPCLKIPYTLSKTGSKIVDSAYRTRVSSMYEQYGYAPYYTLSDSDFTLPMGEIYGLNRIRNQITTTTPKNIANGVRIYGSLTNNDGVLSGFSSANGAQIATPISIAGVNSWEMNFKVTTTSNVSSVQEEIIADTTNGLELAINGAKFLLEIINGNYFGTYTILANTTYYIKLKFTGTQYILSYSTNGTTYTDDITVTSSTKYTGSENFVLGTDWNNGGEYWGGSIDLKGCNVYINNTLAWQGVNSNFNNIYPTIDKPAVIVDSYVNGTSWYRVWSDGWCEQGGYKATTSTAAISYTVDFIKQFKDTNYFFDRSPHWAVDTASVYSMLDNGYRSKTTSSVTFYMHESTIQSGTDWVACGYIA